MLAWKGKPGWAKVGGQFVGLPSDILLKGKAPNPDILAKAANQKQLQQLKEKGSKHVVELKKSDTEGNNRSKASNGEVSET